MRMMIRNRHFSNPYYFLVFIILVGCAELKHEELYKGYSHKGTHSRALVASKDIWVVGGSKGVYTIYNENGNSSFTDSIPGIEDFRDVNILDDGTILFLNSGDKGEIWKVFKGEKNKVFDTPGVFLDGFDFWNNNDGIAYGDPIDGKFFLIKTNDGGNNWIPIQKDKIPNALVNEAGFAASGTGIQCVGASTVFIGSGACDTARLYRSFDKGETWDVVNTPMYSGESFGIYSMYFWSETEGIIIGGSYLEKGHKERICFYTDDAGESWTDRSEGLAGYCSGVHGNKDASLVVATGRVGTYYTLDKGKAWNEFSKSNYYSVFVTENQILFSGKDGIFESIQYSLRNN